MIRLRAFALLFLLGLVAVPAPALAEQPYVYQKFGDGAAQKALKLKAEFETAYGTREARPFGEKGMEELMRLRLSLHQRVYIEGQGGALFTQENGFEAPSGGGEIGVHVLLQEKQYVNLSLGAGYLFDYQGTHVPHAAVSLGRSFGSFDLNLHGLFELPLETARDGVDVIVGLAASYRVVRWFRPGLEALGQDLEGFWEAEEAEGGAKIVVGPTLWFNPVKTLELKLNAGAVLPATNNAPTNLVPGAVPPNTQRGFLARASIGYEF